MRSGGLQAAAGLVLVLALACTIALPVAAMTLPAHVQQDTVPVVHPAAASRVAVEADPVEDALPERPANPFLDAAAVLASGDLGRRLPAGPTSDVLPGDGPPVDPDDLGIPAVVLAAYRNAARLAPLAEAGCVVDWAALAGIGKVESQHGLFHGPDSVIDQQGTVLSRIVGPALDGTGGVQRIADTDGGLWDDDRVWDRAVGPMQFIPTSWIAHGRDGNEDGISDPHNVFDATLAAVEHLCRSGRRDLSDDANLRRALYGYNHSNAYVAQVMRWIDIYRSLSPSDVPVVAVESDGENIPPSALGWPTSSPGLSVGINPFGPPSGDVSLLVPPPAPSGSTSSPSTGASAVAAPGGASADTATARNEPRSTPAVPAKPTPAPPAKDSPTPARNDADDEPAASQPDEATSEQPAPEASEPAEETSEPAGDASEPAEQPAGETSASADEPSEPADTPTEATTARPEQRPQGVSEEATSEPSDEPLDEPAGEPEGASEEPASGSSENPEQQRSEESTSDPTEPAAPASGSPVGGTEEGQQTEPADADGSSGSGEDPLQPEAQDAQPGGDQATSVDETPADAVESTEEPREESTEEPAEESTEEPAEEPTEEPAVESTEEPADDADAVPTSEASEATTTEVSHREPSALIDLTAPSSGDASHCRTDGLWAHVTSHQAFDTDAVTIDAGAVEPVDGEPGQVVVTWTAATGEVGWVSVHDCATGAVTELTPGQEVSAAVTIVAGPFWRPTLGRLA